MRGHDRFSLRRDRQPRFTRVHLQINQKQTHLDQSTGALSNYVYTKDKFTITWKGYPLVAGTEPIPASSRPGGRLDATTSYRTLNAR